MSAPIPLGLFGRFAAVRRGACTLPIGLRRRTVRLSKNIPNAARTHSVIRYGPRERSEVFWQRKFDRGPDGFLGAYQRTVVVTDTLAVDHARWRCAALIGCFALMRATMRWRPILVSGWRVVIAATPERSGHRPLAVRVSSATWFQRLVPSTGPPRQGTRQGS